MDRFSQHLHRHPRCSFYSDPRSLLTGDPRHPGSHFCPRNDLTPFALFAEGVKSLRGSSLPGQAWVTPTSRFVELFLALRGAVSRGEPSAVSRATPTLLATRMRDRASHAHASRHFAVKTARLLAGARRRLRRLAEPGCGPVRGRSRFAAWGITSTKSDEAALCHASGRAIRHPSWR